MELFFKFLKHVYNPFWTIVGIEFKSLTMTKQDTL